MHVIFLYSNVIKANRHSGIAGMQLLDHTESSITKTFRSRIPNPRLILLFTSAVTIMTLTLFLLQVAQHLREIWAWSHDSNCKCEQMPPARHSGSGDAQVFKPRHLNIYKRHDRFPIDTSEPYILLKSQQVDVSSMFKSV
jgi:hypothetical protein